MTWTPTAENINKLEPGLREYIMRLSTDEKRAGLIAKVQILEGQLAAMNKMLEEAPVGVVVSCDLETNERPTWAVMDDREAVPLNIGGKRVRLVVTE
jgi:hypothetical protein